MKLTINTEVLQKYNLSLHEFLVLLLGFNDIDYKANLDSLVDKGIVSRNVFNKDAMILSNNTRDLIARILIESDDRVVASGIDFDALAEKLQSTYPQGVKPGTTYSWSDRTTVIAHKLRTLVAKYDFKFTEEEAINATKEYVDSFDEDKKNMQLLKYFLLRTKRNKDDGNRDIESMFMTIIENNRE